MEGVGIYFVAGCAVFWSVFCRPLISEPCEDELISALCAAGIYWAGYEGLKKRLDDEWTDGTAMTEFYKAFVAGAFSGTVRVFRCGGARFGFVTADYIILP